MPKHTEAERARNAARLSISRNIDSFKGKNKEREIISRKVDTKGKLFTKDPSKFKPITKRPQSAQPAPIITPKKLNQGGPISSGLSQIERDKKKRERAFAEALR